MSLLSFNNPILVFWKTFFDPFLGWEWKPAEATGCCSSKMTYWCSLLMPWLASCNPGLFQATLLICLNQPILVVVTTACNMFSYFSLHHPCTHSLGIISAGGYRSLAEHYESLSREMGWGKALHHPLLIAACLFFWASLWGNFQSVLSFLLSVNLPVLDSVAVITYFQISVAT